ncbi:transglycosylase domain-containing protein [Bartonella doshiae]|uniref:Penicillin-binding protein 4 n=2 Tax=Bartonella doshiae TaxID=33044 RepID=A0A380ZC90_BARDO|nr:PBP1A family penicillin-binding protein [Bartonella doshiae]EJF81970.1 1A family penicillin-binding protein [Bartonella doshiae NCTC 12862 = ATCC 700133]MBB6159318.1 penicillin-binding protein 1A [Bartonella doshiae]SUV44603.1 Penicillin-binding protein 4 precursor [Bartonella doshiae]
MFNFSKKKKIHQNKPFQSPALIELDAWLDTTLYRICSAKSYFWNKTKIASQYFYIRGWKRFIVEILDETLTLGMIGFTLFTIVGISVFELTKQDWYFPKNFSILFLDRYGNPIGHRGAFPAVSVPVEEMPDYVIKAVLATEDRRFFNHWGIDFQGITRAISQNMQAKSVVQGGSTLTQQLAKNLFLTNERTITRKIKEAYLALWLEANFSKRQILQLYLERAYMGGNNFGIAAAAKFYFGKDIRDVSLNESAMLAGLFKAPTKYAPHSHLFAAQTRANVVLSNLVNSGFMTESQIIKAHRHPAKAITKINDSQPDYFLDWAFDEIKKMSDQLPSHTLIVQTTLDPDIQKATEESIAYHLHQYGQQYRATQAAAVILDNNGAVSAIVGGLDYNKSQFNRATQGGRQPGSSFKPYVYATAMERGLSPSTIVLDAPINWGGWSPKNNSGRYLGKIDLATALAFSINTVPVYLTYQYLNRDTQPIINLIKNMGIHAHILSHKTMILGTSNMTPMDQAIGFNVFANGGMAGNCHGFIKIKTTDGHVVWDYEHDGNKLHRVLSGQSAAYMNQMMVGVTTRGSGKRAALPMTLVAGKTGTSQSYRDAWFVGFTGNYTGAVWMGNDNFSPMNRAFGGGVPAMIWHSIMLSAHQNIMLKQLYGVKNSLLPYQPPTRSSNNDFELTPHIPSTLSPETLNIVRLINNDMKKSSTLSLKTKTIGASTF